MEYDKLSEIVVLASLAEDYRNMYLVQAGKLKDTNGQLEQVVARKPGVRSIEPNKGGATKPKERMTAKEAAAEISKRRRRA